MNERRTGPGDRRQTPAHPATDFVDRRQLSQPLPFRDARQWHGDYRYAQSESPIAGGRRRDDNG